LSPELYLPAESAHARLRSATRDAHQHLEDRFDAVERLADPATRAATVAAYARLYRSAEAGLAPLLSKLDGLDYAERRRVVPDVASPTTPAPYPAPASVAEALGQLYVIEGSIMGGRLILRELDARGVREPGLAFLDPYGSRSGSLWRGFLVVLEREAAATRETLADAARGALRGFEHAEMTLCGEVRP
jgi:heme oxygenase